MQPSGQNRIQFPHFLHDGLSTIGLKVLQVPVFPAAPCIGLDAGVIGMSSRNEWLVF